MQSCSFSFNRNTAVRIFNQGALIKDCIFEFNTGVLGGGMAQILDSHTDLSLFKTNMVILSNASFKSNTAKYGGK